MDAKLSGVSSNAACALNAQVKRKLFCRGKKGEELVLSNKSH